MSRARIIVIGAAVAAVAAFAAVYFLFFTGDSPPPLKLSTPSSTTAGATTPTTGGAVTPTAPTTAAATGNASAGVTGKWTVGASSVARYRVREKLARLPAQSDAVGTTSAVSGSIQVDKTAGQLVIANGAKFEVDVTKLRSDEAQRDNRIRVDGLESNRFPTATFTSTGPIELPSSAESGGAVKSSVTGDLTIHGVTKRVTIPLDAQMSGGRIEVVGSLSFPFSDFGMRPPSIAGIVSVGDTATLEFQLFFDKA